MKSIILGAGLVIGMASAGAASTITVNDGDDIGALMVGTTTLTGAVSGSCVAGGLAGIDCLSEGNPADTFNFSIGAGTALTGISLSATGDGPAGFGLETFGVSVDRTPGVPTIGVTVDLDADPVDGLFAFLNGLGVGPIPADALQFQIGTQFSAEAEGDFFANYSIGLTVASLAAPAPVPLPASAPLLLVALGGMFALRRRALAKA